MRVSHPERVDSGAWHRSCTILGIGLFLIASLWLAFHARLNADEGFYLACARFVADGLVPYRDFGLTQPPGMPWVYALLLECFGWDLLGLRVAGWFLTAVSVLVATVVVVRIRGWGAAVAFAVLLLGAPQWLAFMMKGKTYALAGLAVMLASVTLVVPGRYWLRFAVFTGAAALGTVTRLPCAPYFAVAAASLILQAQGRVARGISAVALIGAAGIVVWFAMGGAPEEALFWTIGYHQEVVAPRSAAVRWSSLLESAPAICVAACVALAVGWRKWSEPHTAILLGATLAVGLNVGSGFGYGEYAAPFLASAAFGIALALPPASSVPRVMSVTLAFVAIAIGWLRPPQIDADLLKDAREASDCLRVFVPEGGWVVASMPEIAVAAGVRIPPELAMGKFALSETISDGDARRFGMVTPRTLESLMRDPACGAVVLSTAPVWNFGYSMPRLQYVSRETTELLRRTLADGYRLVLENDNYVIFARFFPDEDALRQAGAVSTDGEFP